MLDDAERQMGYEEAQLNASIFDATRSYGLKQFGVELGQYSSDISAMNAITTSAAVAPTASFQTIKPIDQNPPEKPSALGPILGGFAAGVGAYAGLEAAS